MGRLRAVFRPKLDLCPDAGVHCPEQQAPLCAEDCRCPHQGGMGGVGRTSLRAQGRTYANGKRNCRGGPGAVRFPG